MERLKSNPFPIKSPRLKKEAHKKEENIKEYILKSHKNWNDWKL